MGSSVPLAAAAALCAGLLAGCGGAGRGAAPTSPTPPSTSPSASPITGERAAEPSRAPLPRPFRHRIPGMPAPLAGGVYAADGPGGVRPRIAREPAYLYVPNSYGAGTTTVIDQRTRKVVRVLQTGQLSQHVTPSYDLRTLYVEASDADRLVAIDPHTGRIERRIPVNRPYNLYFTPSGRQAVVMDEDHDQIAFTDPRSFRRQQVVTDRSCQGPNHADFSANGRYFLVSCEFSGSLIEISTLRHRVIGRLDLPPGSKPQDVRLAPDGRSFFVADMGRDLLLQIPWDRFRVAHAYPTLAMPHGIYPSRNARYLYVSDRAAGAVQVFSLERHRFVDTWRIPGGGSPDMGGVSADGRTLWLSGRYDGYVYGWNTHTGRLVARIKVGSSPHGLLVWPQPGRYSLGHTGNMR